MNLLLSSLICALMAIPAPIDKTRRVHDFANSLSADAIQRLESMGQQVERETTAQLTIVTVTSLEGQSIEQYANTLFNQWGIGQKETNNGVLLLIAPNDRRVRIEVGYGVEPLLSDGLCGEILDEFDEIGKSDKSKFDRKYIPTNRTNVQKSLINYSIQSEILRSIKVKNSITDLEMNGKIYLFGDLQNPRLNGSVQSSILNSKFVFKGHEFFITYGKIDFISELQDRGPLLNFIAQSTVESYKVKLAVYGHVADMSIDLTSTPALSQQDILSLLTLGITSSDSSKLQEDERSYLTSVGIGSLLADRFKINQGLKSSLGLNFSIAPELTQSGESLLPTQGKTSTSTSQYKSATKLKVQKKVNDLVDVSVSSTVGSTQGQKQELNVNLNLSQTVSVQGVYEVKSSNEETTQQSPGSLGLDLLFRKTFK